MLVSARCAHQWDAHGVTKGDADGGRAHAFPGQLHALLLNLSCRRLLPLRRGALVWGRRGGDTLTLGVHTNHGGGWLL
jgi:hypothetical protein